MEMTSLIISIVSAIVAVLSVIISFVVMQISKKTLERHHESLRREKALELLLHWGTTLHKNSALVRKYVEELDKTQTEQLYKQEEITFDTGSKELCTKIKKLLDVKAAENSENKLTPAECTELRWLVVTYLNKLEGILIAWRHSIADTKIIEEQFSYLINPDTEHEVLKEFRQAAGGNKSYPSIALFCKHMNDKYKIPIDRKQSL